MPGEGDPFTHASKRAALAVATFGAFMTPFDGSVVNLALPTIGHDFRSDVVALGWIITAYVLGLTICVIPFGRLADIRGRRRIYVAGVANRKPSTSTGVATMFVVYGILVLIGMGLK